MMKITMKYERVVSTDILILAHGIIDNFMN
jgi:hypothetical protein